MTYATIKSAAETRMGGDSTGAWALADALLAEVPAGTGHGGDRTKVLSTQHLAQAMDEVADRLEADGIETPQGNPYTSGGLADLRYAAMNWPPDTRHALAAFRTHSEAIGQGKRAVLAALCTAAASGSWDEVPDTVAPDAWARAAASVGRKVTNGTRYPVSVNDLRTALSGRTNLPVRTPADGDMRDAIRAVAEVRRLSVYAVKILAASPQPTGEWLEALGGFADTLDMLAGYVRTLVSGGGVTDESLEALLAGEGR